MIDGKNISKIIYGSILDEYIVETNDCSLQFPLLNKLKIEDFKKKSEPINLGIKMDSDFIINNKKNLPIIKEIVIIKKNPIKETIIFPDSCSQYYEENLKKESNKSINKNGNNINEKKIAFQSEQDLQMKNQNLAAYFSTNKDTKVKEIPKNQKRKIPPKKNHKNVNISYSIDSSSQSNDADSDEIEEFNKINAEEENDNESISYDSGCDGILSGEERIPKLMKHELIIHNNKNIKRNKPKEFKKVTTHLNSNESSSESFKASFDDEDDDDVILNKQGSHEDSSDFFDIIPKGKKEKKEKKEKEEEDDDSFDFFKIDSKKPESVKIEIKDDDDSDNDSDDEISKFFSQKGKEESQEKIKSIQQNIESPRLNNNNNNNKQDKELIIENSEKEEGEIIDLKSSCVFDGFNKLKYALDNILDFDKYFLPYQMKNLGFDVLTEESKIKINDLLKNISAYFSLYTVSMGNHDILKILKSIKLIYSGAPPLKYDIKNNIKQITEESKKEREIYIETHLKKESFRHNPTGNGNNEKQLDLIFNTIKTILESLEPNENNYGSFTKLLKSKSIQTINHNDFLASKFCMIAMNLDFAQFIKRKKFDNEDLKKFKDIPLCIFSGKEIHIDDDVFFFGLIENDNERSKNWVGYDKLPETPYLSKELLKSLRGFYVLEKTNIDFKKEFLHLFKLSINNKNKKIKNNNMEVEKSPIKDEIPQSSPKIKQQKKRKSSDLPKQKRKSKKENEDNVEPKQQNKKRKSRENLPEEPKTIKKRKVVKKPIVEIIIKEKEEEEEKEKEIIPIDFNDKKPSSSSSSAFDNLINNHYNHNNNGKKEITYNNNIFEYIKDKPYYIQWTNKSYVVLINDIWKELYHLIQKDSIKNYIKPYEKLLLNESLDKLLYPGSEDLFIQFIDNYILYYNKTHKTNEWHSLRLVKSILEFFSIFICEKDDTIKSYPYNIDILPTKLFEEGTNAKFSERPVLLDLILFKKDRLFNAGDNEIFFNVFKPIYTTQIFIQHEKLWLTLFRDLFCNNLK